MLQMHRPEHATTIVGVDTQGRQVATSPASVLAVVPDQDHPARTRLHVADGIVLVDGKYEDWMETLACGWTHTRTEPFDPEIVGMRAEGLRWDAPSHPTAIAG